MHVVVAVAGQGVWTCAHSSHTRTAPHIAQAQMQAKKAAEEAARVEREQWEEKKQREIEDYNPWGKVARPLHTHTLLAGITTHPCPLHAWL